MPRVNTEYLVHLKITHLVIQWIQDGLTAMMVATDKGNQSIVEVLLEGGADVNYKHQVRLMLFDGYIGDFFHTSIYSYIHEYDGIVNFYPCFLYIQCHV